MVTPQSSVYWKKPGTKDSRGYHSVCMEFKGRQNSTAQICMQRCKTSWESQRTWGVWSALGGREVAVTGRGLWGSLQEAALGGVSFLPWAVVATH